MIKCTVLLIKIVELSSSSSHLPSYKQAFAFGSEWRTMDVSARGKLMFKLADLMEANAEYIAKLDTIDNGKYHLRNYLQWRRIAMDHLKC